MSGGLVLGPFLVDFCLSVRRVSSKNWGIGWVRGYRWAIDIDFNLSVRRVSSKNRGSIEMGFRVRVYVNYMYMVYLISIAI